MSGACKKASLLKGLNNPDVLKLFSTIFDISEPIFCFFKTCSKLFREFSSIDRGETATGRGFRLPLVISTSINAKEFIGINIKNSEIIFFIILIFVLSF